MFAKHIALLLRKSVMSKKKLHTYCILEGHLHFYLDKVMVRATLGGFWETWGGLWGGLGRTLGKLLGGLEGLGGTRSRRREKEEETQQTQEEKRKKQHKRSSKREGRSNSKGKKNLYINSRSTALAGPILQSYNLILL